MDSGEAQHFSSAVRQLESITHSIPATLTMHEKHQGHVIDNVQTTIGMPWTQSIVPTQELTFMPFWMHQMDFMKSHLKDLQANPATNKAGTRQFSLSEGDNVRIANLCFTSSHFRKIRMTYYDAGPQVQVFNSLWYPAAEYNLPVLGIDLLQFHGGKKHLAVMDFQPIHESQEGHAVPNYEELLLKPIRDQYPSLQGKMSSRFYDENQFFSKAMLFARFQDASIVTKDVMPAFEQYLDAYLTLVHSTDPSFDHTEIVLERQRAYDVYSAQRDPALHMFKAKFGETWADEFVHEFLFDQSR